MAARPVQLLKLIQQDKINNYDHWFELMASELFYNCELKLKNKRYEITEIEFYINEPDYPDVFSHSSEDQKLNGQFCFHRLGQSYKEGNYKGVDIAIGNQERFGGILIRALFNLDTLELIEGPSNVVSEILMAFKYKKVRDLVGHIDLAITGSDLQICKRKNAVVTKPLHLKTPRVGLTLKRPAPEKNQFLVKDYRFLKYPEATKKGRHWIIASALLKSHSLKLPGKVSLRYESLINQGQKKKTSEITLNEESSINDFIEFYGHFSLND